MRLTAGAEREFALALERGCAEGEGLACLAEAAAARLERRGFGWIFPAATLVTALECALLLLLYPSQATQQLVHNAVLSETNAAETVAVPPPYHPIFRRDGTAFWYNGAMIERVYAAFCAKKGCADDLRRQDEALWNGTKPSFAFCDPRTPEQCPPRWQERQASYAPTPIPDLFVRSRP